jgi:hypothetical protein
MPTPTKPKPVSNPFEQITEAVIKEPAKQTVQAVGDIINPVNMFREIMGMEKKSENAGQSQREKIEQEFKKQNSTAIDVNKLQEKYNDQDKIKMDALRNKLFNLVKSDEKKAIEEIKQEEMERKRKFEEEEQKKKQEEYQKQQEASQHVEAQGKQRGQLGAPRRKAQADPTMENKISRGK